MISPIYIYIYQKDDGIVHVHVEWFCKAHLISVTLKLPTSLAELCAGAVDAPSGTDCRYLFLRMSWIKTKLENPTKTMVSGCQKCGVTGVDVRSNQLRGLLEDPWVFGRWTVRVGDLDAPLERLRSLLLWAFGHRVNNQ